MMILSLTEMCKGTVAFDFRTNGAVINVYDLGDQVCNDIVNNIMICKGFNDDIVDRLQLMGMESLNLDFDQLKFSEKMSCWLAEIVAAGLEDLHIGCPRFSETIAKAIVDRYTEFATISSVSSEQEESPAPAVAALRTLRIREYACNELEHLAQMLPIFASTLEKLDITCWGRSASAQQSQKLLNAIGKLDLHTLSLQLINFRHISSFTVSPSMKNLKELGLKSLKGLTDHHVSLFLEVAGQSIRFIRIEYCNEITDITLQNIRLHCPNLVSLELIDNENLTSAGLEQFFATASLKKLRRLSLMCNPGVTDAVVAKFATVGHLTYVKLESHEITSQSLQSLASIKTLKSVNLDLCHRLHKSDIVSFMTRHGLDHCRVYDHYFPDGWIW